MKKQFYIAPVSEIVTLSYEGPVCNAATIIEMGFYDKLLNGDDL